MQRPDTRALVDVGALATTLAFAWGVGEDFRWVMLAVIAAGIAAAAVSHGWAAPASERPRPALDARRRGPHRARTAPPARVAGVRFATSALWDALRTSPDAASLPVESYALPPAVGLLAFAVLLVWLRRQGEAAVAVTASLLSRSGRSRRRGLDGVAGARHRRRPRLDRGLRSFSRGRPPSRAHHRACAGAATAVFALALACAQRAITDAPAGAAWLVLLVGASYAAALGATRPLRAGVRALAVRSGRDRGGRGDGIRRGACSPRTPRSC